jgi:membrane protein implicated in regulation of membrane protease activity
MQRFEFEVGGRARAVGCLILALPFIVLGGVLLLLTWIAGGVGDLLLPSDASGFARVLVGVIVIWLVLRLTRPLRHRRRRPPGGPGGRSGVIDI